MISPHCTTPDILTTHAHVAFHGPRLRWVVFFPHIPKQIPFFSLLLLFSLSHCFSGLSSPVYNYFYFISQYAGYPPVLNYIKKTQCQFCFDVSVFCYFFYQNDFKHLRRRFIETTPLSLTFIWTLCVRVVWGERNLL